ncbi:hypothetical protein EVAR_35353_1 [Eumeta japonica]|uniref:Uncharacterized protein n=1 Tax=Eumeta variegata TaxID=151549 RepID=A0A4C1XJX2_EUMVA|nr:hypothetical protein EVAR_35353_1 [Eumeta japonica]
MCPNGTENTSVGMRRIKNEYPLDGISTVGCTDKNTMSTRGPRARADRADTPILRYPAHLHQNALTLSLSFPAVTYIQMHILSGLKSDSELTELKLYAELTA